MKLMKMILAASCAMSGVIHADSTTKNPSASSKAPEDRQFIVDFDMEFFTRSPFESLLRDPFKNLPGFAKTDSISKAKWPKLDAVKMRKGKIPYVLLDGRKYKEGQFIDSNRYVSGIGENFVTISEGNFDYELVMKEKDAVAPTSEMEAATKKDLDREPAFIKELSK